MTILDRYIVRQFLISFLFGLLAFVLIFLVIDMTENLDDFMDAGVDTMTVVQYYVSFTPEIIKLMTPVAMLLAALFITGRMASQNELAAMKSSGVSLYRIMVPFLIVALVVSLVSIYFNGWVVPYANQTKFNIERVHLRKGYSSSSRYDIFFQEGRTRLVSIGFYDSNLRLASRVSIQEFSDTNQTVLIRRYDASMMRWRSPDDVERDSTQETGWILVLGTYRELGEGNQRLEFFEEKPIGKLSLAPSDIEKKQRKPDEMDYGELKEFITNQANAGQMVSRWLVDYHAKIAFPFASLIVVLFGVPLSSNKRKGGVALEFGISTAVTFIYLAFMKISQVFGYNGDLNPLLTAWMANIIFLIAGIANLIRVQK